ncbi:29913_t:CDS:2, partial [Gigaspora margarita]
QDNKNQNEDYDLDNEIKNDTLADELNERSDKILPDEPVENNKYTPCIIIDNDNDDRKICRSIETLKPCLPKDLIYSQVDSFDKLALSTLLIIQIAFKLAKIDLSVKAKVVLLKEKECAYFGNLLEESL